MQSISGLLVCLLLVRVRRWRAPMPVSLSWKASWILLFQSGKEYSLPAQLPSCQLFALRSSTQTLSPTWTLPSTSNNLSSFHLPWCHWLSSSLIQRLWVHSLYQDGRSSLLQSLEPSYSSWTSSFYWMEQIWLGTLSFYWSSFLWSTLL